MSDPPRGVDARSAAERLSEALTSLRERTPAPAVAKALPAAEPRPASAHAAPAPAPAHAPPARAPAEPPLAGVFRRRRLSPLRRWLERARSG